MEETILLNKKIIMLTIILVSILTLSVVSATENITNNAISIEESNEEISLVNDNNSPVKINDEIPITETENELNGTFTDLKNDIANAGSELKLNKNYNYNAEDNMVNGITINKKIVIDGNGFVINGNNQSRAFIISSDNVILKNISFVNCFSNDYGGAIYWSNANGILKDCSFSNCYVENQTKLDVIIPKQIHYGGAIYWKGSDGSITNCDFDDCYLKCIYSSGGAIYISGERSVVSECIFTNCISIQNKGYGLWQGGGAISIDGNNINISRSKFYNNTANNIGGALYIGGNNVNVDKSIFYNNSANYSGSNIYWRGEYGTIINSNITHAIYKCSPIVWIGSYGTIRNSLFEKHYNNGTDGGVIEWNGKFGTIESSSFTNNYGTAIYWVGSDGKISESKFINNAAGETNNYGAGAIYVNIGGSAENPLINNCSFINNSGSFGGAIYCSRAYIINCSFINNHASYNNHCSSFNGFGGAIYSSGELEYNYIIITGNKFINNSADNIGGALYGASFDVTNSSFINNKVINEVVTYGNNGIILAAYGGAGYLLGQCSFVNSTFTNNTAKYVNNLYGNIYVENCTMDGKLGVYDCSGKKSFHTFDISYDKFMVQDYVTLKVKVPKEVSGTITFTVPKDIVLPHGDKNDIYTAKINNGSAEVTIYGRYGIKVTVSYSGSYESQSKTINCVATKYDAPLNYSIGEVIADTEFKVYWNMGDNFTYTSGTYSGPTIEMYINNEYYSSSVDSINRPITIPGLPSGDYNYTIEYSGSILYNPITINGTLTIIKNNLSMACVAPNCYSGENPLFNIRLSKNCEGNITLIINNKTFIEKIESPQLNINIPALPSGNYEYKILYSGDNSYNEIVLVNILEVYKKIPTIVVSDFSTIYNDENYLTIKLTDNQGNPLKGENILININGLERFTTDSNGQVKVPTKDLVPNIYDVTITFNGNDYYSSSSAEVKVTVNKMSSSIVSSDMTEIYNDGKILTATLKTNDGTPISGATVYVNLNGIKTLITDNNGQMKLSTNGLTPKTYTATITFNGNNNYAKSTTNVKVTVKKATPKITAKTKTFKRTLKTKKYTITLKTNQNKVMKNTKVTIKINKKTYTAKTNSKGIATFKITKLTKKGTFKAVITYKGNTYYNKITKTTYIKCK